VPRPHHPAPGHARRRGGARPVRTAALSAATAGVAAAAVAAVAAAAPRARAAGAAGTGPALPASALAVWRGGRWVDWWHSGRAPAEWSAADAPLAAAVPWRAAAPGVEVGEVRLAGGGEAWRFRVVAVRLDPARVRLSLAAAADGGGRRGGWTIDAAGPGAALAVNAGQFRGGVPWGWVVHEGREYRAPGAGPLAPAVVVDDAGRVRLVPAGAIAALRARPGAVREAFQSYPALLAGGRVPAPLRAPGRGVDVAHRDARLALGTLPDGRVLVALTRFDAPGAALGAALDATLGAASDTSPEGTLGARSGAEHTPARAAALGAALGAVPFGPTVPEMAAVVGALGARDAVLLDGGISAQLLVRGAAGARRWPGLRRVPLGLVAEAR
jgi:hypothetical protein